MRLLFATLVFCMLFSAWSCKKTLSSSIAKAKLYRVDYLPTSMYDIYDYDAQGRLRSIVTYVSSVLGNSDTFYYDSFGRLSSYISTMNGVPFVQRHLFTYGDAGGTIKSTDNGGTRAIKMDVQGSVGGPFETFSKSDIIYDDVKGTQTMTVFNPGGKAYGRYVYTRDAEDNVTHATYIYTDTIQGIDIPAWWADYTYDGGKTPFEGMNSVIFYRCSNGYENFQYTQPHNVLVRDAVAFANNIGYPAKTNFKYEFNDLGYPVKKTIDNGSTNPVIETYEYK